MTKRFLTVFIVIFVLSILQTSFLNELLGTIYNPNIVLALAFALLLADQFDLSMFAGLTGGFLIDLTGFGVIGTSSFSLVLLLLIAHLIRRYVFKSFMLQIFVFFGLGLLLKLISFEKESGFWESNLVAVSITILVTLIFYIVTQYLILKEMKSEYKIK